MFKSLSFFFFSYWILLFMLKALGSFSAVFGEEWKEKTDRDFVKVILRILNYFKLHMVGLKS